MKNTNATAHPPSIKLVNGEPLKKQALRATYKLRRNKLVTHKHVIPSLSLFKYISHSFKDLIARAQGCVGECAGADVENKDGPRDQTISFVALEARRSFLLSKAKLSTVRFDGRRQYGVPPAGNANFVSLPHFNHLVANSHSCAMLES